MSVMSVSTRAVPSGSSTTAAVEFTSRFTRTAEAMPMPISHSPSRRVPGSGRSAQPKVSAPRRRQSANRFELNGRPDDGSLSGMLRSRSSTGQRPAFSASSSIAISTIGTPIASPGARIEPGGVMFTEAMWWPMRRFSPA